MKRCYERDQILMIGCGGGGYNLCLWWMNLAWSECRVVHPWESCRSSMLSEWFACAANALLTWHSWVSRCWNFLSLSASTLIMRLCVSTENSNCLATSLGRGGRSGTSGNLVLTVDPETWPTLPDSQHSTSLLSWWLFSVSSVFFVREEVTGDWTGMRCWLGVKKCRKSTQLVTLLAW